MKILLRLIAAILFSVGAALPAHAAVTITFWSHEFGSSFPHAFISLRGTPDAGGAPVDSTFGFTAKSLTPAILWGPVPGKLDIPTPGYVADSTAQFSLVLTDTQYAAILALAAAADSHGPDSTYSLKTHNCIHFVEEAARLAGLTQLDYPRLMRKPRSYLHAVAAANAAKVTIIDRSGSAYLATVPALASPAAVTATAKP